MVSPRSPVRQETVLTESNQILIGTTRKCKQEKKPKSDSTKSRKNNSSSKIVEPKISKRKVLAEIRDILVKLQSIV